jgi:hypothetical protein
LSCEGRSTAADRRDGEQSGSALSDLTCSLNVPGIARVQAASRHRRTSPLAGRCRVDLVALDLVEQTRYSSVWAMPSGSGRRGARIHTSCAVVATPTLDRAFARWCFTVEWDRPRRWAAAFSDPATSESGCGPGGGLLDREPAGAETQGVSSTAAVAVLAPGDLRRPAIGRAVRAALLAALAFEVFTVGTKEVPPIYQHVPWADDPYDTFVSLAIFFVPLAVLAAGARLPLCQRADPLPAVRARGVVRAAWLAVAVSLATVAADWAGVLLADRPVGHDVVAAASVLALALTTAAVLGGAVALARVRVPAAASGQPDGIRDGLALALLAARHLGPAGRPLAAVAESADARVAPLVRRRPVASAALVALAFALALALSSAREEGLSPVALLIGAVAACAMFAFAVAGGAWLGIVAPGPSTAAHRRLVAAAVAGAAAVPASLAFRDAIWSAAGMVGDHGPGDLAALVALTGAAVFLSVLLLSTFHFRADH